MNAILKDIIVKKKEDLRENKKRVSLEKLKESMNGVLGNKKHSGMRFLDSLSVARNDIYVIGEVKFASPTNPNLGAPEELLSRVKQYEEAGADAISIITEKHFFKGDLSFVTKVKEAVGLPILQKDFVIDEYQIYESARKGADALLLISRLVDGKTLKQFVELCLIEGIEPVVEVYSEEDLEKAVVTETRFIAVNSRDLDTFEVDVEQACNLMRNIPGRFIRLGFSGIKSAGEVRKYREVGARGVLVGTALMKTDNIGELVDKLKK